VHLVGRHLNYTTMHWYMDVKFNYHYLLLLWYAAELLKYVMLLNINAWKRLRLLAVWITGVF